LIADNALLKGFVEQNLPRQSLICFKKHQLNFLLVHKKHPSKKTAA